MNPEYLACRFRVNPNLTTSTLSVASYLRDEVIVVKYASQYIMSVGKAAVEVGSPLS